MFGIHFSVRRFLALAMTLSVIPFQLPAKDKKKQAAAAESMRSAGLKIYVLEGRNAVNFIPDRKGTTPVVEVRDDNGLPVEMATVEFRLPDSGAGGEFEDGKHVKAVVTNTAGQAQAPFTVNSQTGSFSIPVKATIDTRMGSALILQSNSMKAVLDGTMKPGNHHWYKNWKVLAVLGAAGTVTAVILLTRGSSGTTVVLTPGGPNFGTPH